MNHLSIQVNKKSCVFVLHISDPSETLRKIAMFFKDRNIIIDNLSMHRYQNGEANVIIHCQVEKDRIFRTVQMMEELPGIMELERMEGK